MVSEPATQAEDLRERANQANYVIAELADALAESVRFNRGPAADEQMALVAGLVQLAALVVQHPQLATVLRPQLANLSAGVLDIPARAAVLETAVVELGATVLPAAYSGAAFAGHVVESVGPRPLLLRARATARRGGATRESVQFALAMAGASLPFLALYMLIGLGLS